jgi:uncharacterized protein
VTSDWPAMGLDVEAMVESGWRPVPFRQFILKVHSRCNLSCGYCYMYQFDRGWASLPVSMSPAVVRQTCRRIAEHAAIHELDRVTVALHGGEPLLVGPAALAELALTLRRELSPETVADLVVQTNGVLLDEAFLAVLQEHDIRVGLSLDGTRATNDRHRQFHDGRGSHAYTARGLRLLGTERFRGMFAGLLCVIDLAADPVTTYESLLTYGPPRIDFLLPHGNWSAPPPGRSVGSRDTPYGDWLIAAFERWFGVPALETEVRMFAEIINLVLGGQGRSESVGLSPVALITVNTDGSLEQVDSLRSAHQGAAATGLNVTDDSFDDALRHPAIVARQIGLAALAETCQRCELRRVCGGGHYVHRYRRGTGFRNPSVYCPDLTKLIGHIVDRVRADIPVPRA